MTNKYRGEAPFPEAGDGVFLCFTMQDLAELEEIFGPEFFTVIEEAGIRNSAKTLMEVLKIAVKKRDAATLRPVRAFDQVNLDDLNAGEWAIGSMAKPILNALAQSWLHKSYDELVEEAQKAQEEQAKVLAANVIEHLKEAAGEDDVPFTAEALSAALLRLGSDPASLHTTSGG